MLRRMRLSTLFAALAGALAVVAVLAGIASAVSGDPVPKEKPLALAIHDALAGSSSVQGVTAEVTWTNHLLEGASIATGEQGGPASSPLIAGAHGRIWIDASGRFRLELQSDEGDTEIYWDGTTFTMYQVSSGTIYRYRPPAQAEGEKHEQGPVPSVAKIEEGLAHLEKSVKLSGAEPTDVAGHAAYTVRFSPLESGSLLAGAELSFDAENAVPLRAAVYATSSSEPVMELAAQSVSYGPVASSIFQPSVPAGTKVVQVHMSKPGAHTSAKHPHGARPQVAIHGKGIAAIISGSVHAGHGGGSSLSSLPTVTLGTQRAQELKTALGTIVTFVRGGTRYFAAGSDLPSKVEAVARGL